MALIGSGMTTRTQSLKSTIQGGATATGRSVSWCKITMVVSPIVRIRPVPRQMINASVLVHSLANATTKLETEKTEKFPHGGWQALSRILNFLPSPEFWMPRSCVFARAGETLPAARFFKNSMVQQSDSCLLLRKISKSPFPISPRISLVMQ